METVPRSGRAPPTNHFQSEKGRKRGAWAWSPVLGSLAPCCVQLLLSAGMKH